MTALPITVRFCRAHMDVAFDDETRCQDAGRWHLINPCPLGPPLEEPDPDQENPDMTTKQKEPTVNTTLNTLTVNGVEYVAADSLKSIDTGPTERRIVIAQRGWVFVGLWNQDGDDITLTDAKCIRIWGTQNGLGELRNGPLKDTKLDECGTVRLHRLAVVATIDVAGGSW